jgi:NitT/TauT family transport system permease protein/taurine transport system permease protein
MDAVAGTAALHAPWYLRAISGIVRWLDGYPGLKSFAPFVPILLLWEGIARSGIFPRIFFPSLGDVILSFGNLVYKGILPEYLGDSIVRLILGAGVGVAAGVPLGLLVGLNRFSHRFFWPLIIFFQAIGDIAWLPILLIWFGFGLVTMTFVIVYTVIFPVVFNTVLGVRSVPVEVTRAAQTLGASPFRIVLEVIVPGALPNIMTGLRNGLGWGWRALIASEMIVGTSGVGFMMFDARRAGQVTEVLLGMILLGLLWYVVDGWILVPLEQATVQRWGVVARTD